VIARSLLTKMAALMNPKWNGQFSCFDLVAKTDESCRSVVRVRDIEIGGSDFVVMAGPCAVESETQLLQTAEAVAEAGARILRGGAYKPRSSPYAFQGLGVESFSFSRAWLEALPPHLTDLCIARGLNTIYMLQATSFELRKAMGFDLQQTIALLSRTPSALNALLRDLPQTWTLGNEGSKTWSPFDIVGHLIHGERTDWMPRARIILQHGENRAFDPFDRLAQERESEGKSLGDLLDEFARVRSESLDALRTMNLQPQDFERRGCHPALGTVTLAQLLATWAVHDMTHLHQISRVMAYQYREVVGPWRAYLGVLHCEGHGA
jgi:hypothetical protein